MILYDCHIHTTFSDGKNTPEETVQFAIKMGLTKVGFSDHSYTFFDESYCMPKNSSADYRKCISGLKKKYGDKIEILCGVEQDFYSDESTDDYDYIIGSVHYLKIGDCYIPVDESADILQRAVDDYFDGDVYKLIDEYYKTIAKVVEKTNADIIGHFDLITKFNENNQLFNESDSRYMTSAQAAADKLISTGVPFEINTGAISRGYKSCAYPSSELIAYIKNHGGRFVLSSDSHAKEYLCSRFDEYYKFLA